MAEATCHEVAGQIVINKSLCWWGAMLLPYVEKFEELFKPSVIQKGAQLLVANIDIYYFSSIKGSCWGESGETLHILISFSQYVLNFQRFIRIFWIWKRCLISHNFGAIPNYLVFLQDKLIHPRTIRGHNAIHFFYHPVSLLTQLANRLSLRTYWTFHLSYVMCPQLYFAIP